MRGMRLCVVCPLLAAVLALVLMLLAPVRTHAQIPVDPQKPISFLDHVAPILKENCFACHDAKKRRGRLDLTTFEKMMQGGDRGPAVVAKNPKESPLWLLVTGQDEPIMPPKEAGGLLPKDKVAVIERWIKEGAKFDGPNPSADLLVELRKRWLPPTPPPAYRYPAIVRAIAFAPQGDTLVTGGYHELLVWDYKNGKLLKRIHTRAERANAIVFLPDGKTIAVAGGRPGQEGDVRFYNLAAKGKVSGGVEHLDGVDAKAGVFIRELVQVDDEILSLAISPDGKKIAAGGCDRLVRVWDAEKFTLEQTIENHADWVLGLVFTPDSKRILTASRDKTAKGWDLAAKESVLAFPGHQVSVNCIAIKPDGRVGVSGGDDRQIRFWNAAADAKQIRTAGGHTDKVERVLYHPTRALVISASDDKTVRFWNPDTGAAVRTLTGHKDCVFALALSPDGNLVASGAWDGEIRIWKVDDGTLVKSFNGSPGVETAGK